MQAPLRSFTVFIWVISVAGAAVVALLAAGWFSWVSFALAAVAGLVVGVPAGIWTARAIKREDPNWSTRRSESRQAEKSRKPAQAQR